MPHDFKIRKPTPEDIAEVLKDTTIPLENAAAAFIFGQVQTNVREARKLARKGSGHLAIEGLCDTILSGITLAQSYMNDGDKG